MSNLQQMSAEQVKAEWERLEVLKVERYNWIFPDGANKWIIELLLMIRRHRELKIIEARIPGLDRYKQAAEIANAIGAKFIQLNEPEKKLLLEAISSPGCIESEEVWQELLEVHFKRNPEDKKLIAEIEARLSAMPGDLSESFKM